MTAATPPALLVVARQARTLRNRLAHAEAERERAELRILQLVRQLEAIERVLAGDRAANA